MITYNDLEKLGGFDRLDGETYISYCTNLVHLDISDAMSFIHGISVDLSRQVVYAFFGSKDNLNRVELLNVKNSDDLSDLLKLTYLSREDNGLSCSDCISLGYLKDEPFDGIYCKEFPEYSCYIVISFEGNKPTVELLSPVRSDDVALVPMFGVKNHSDLALLESLFVGAL